jgi:ribosomal-protein-alanine N-acetyltransferase
MRYWAPGHDRSIEDTRRRIAQIDTHWHSRGFGDWGVIEKATGRLIGFAGLHYIEAMPEVNVGYAFERAMWGRGFASETCRAVLAFGFQEVRLEQIVAVIAPANEASIRVAERCGLRLWKRFRWTGRDRLAYRIRREEYQSTPPASGKPHPNAAIRGLARGSIQPKPISGGEPEDLPQPTETPAGLGPRGTAGRLDSPDHRERSRPRGAQTRRDERNP